MPLGHRGFTKDESTWIRFENVVHVFQRPSGCFRIETKDHREIAVTEDGKYCGKDRQPDEKIEVGMEFLRK